ncbi:uncharacterized protein TNCT_209041, partial [Trichonephila clavata]
GPRETDELQVPGRGGRWKELAAHIKFRSPAATAYTPTLGEGPGFIGAWLTPSFTVSQQCTVDFDIVNTLNETRSLLDQLKHDYPKISLQFKKWKSQRIRSIDTVHDLLKKLQKIEYSCRVAQGTGAALALAGQVTALVLCLCGYKDSDKLLTTSKACSVAGFIHLSNCFGAKQNVGMAFYGKDAKKLWILLNSM